MPQEKHTGLCAATGILLFLLSSVSCSSQAPHWFVRYDGPAGEWDAAIALAADPSGNIFVAGSSYGVSTNSDYTVVKYDKHGQVLWVNRYDGTAHDLDRVSSMDVDAAGNICVTGKSQGVGTSNDYLTLKYGTDGSLEWAARYDGPISGIDVANDVAFDPSGNVYVTGYSYGIQTLGDFTTVKYDFEGNQLWAARYNGPGNGLDVPKALVVDNEGNVYVTGESVDRNDSYTTIKYDTDGNELWVARYSGTSLFNDFARAIALDVDGNVVVTGFSTGEGTGIDFATVKYDGNGNELWVARYNGPGNSRDAAHSIAIDDSGNVFVTGQSQDEDDDFDYATLKYDPGGNQLWAARYNGPGDAFDVARSIVLDNRGNVIVTGRSHGQGTHWDYATIVYDTDGNQKWLARYNSSEMSDDRAFAVMAPREGEIFVTGRSRKAGGANDFLTIKYSIQ